MPARLDPPRANASLDTLWARAEYELIFIAMSRAARDPTRVEIMLDCNINRPRARGVPRFFQPVEIEDHAAAYFHLRSYTAERGFLFVSMDRCVCAKQRV
jgi:hypothetical protein